MIQAYIGLGSNLNSPKNQLNSAIESLKSTKGIQDLVVSPFYQSPPFGPIDQPDFINAAASFKTDLPPLKLLDCLQAIELKQGRTREIHWGPRTLDLDILIYGDQEISDPRLYIPHPHLKNRAFALKPLLDIEPSLTLPSGVPLASLLNELPEGEVEALRPIK